MKGFRMMGSNRLRKSIYFFFWFFLFIQGSPAVQAAPLSMQYQLGFNGFFQIKKWTPITILLENEGRDIRGILEIVVTSGSEFRRDLQAITHTLAVELPSHSKKLCSFTIQIDTFTHPLVIRLRQDRTVLLTETLNLRTHFTDKQLVLMTGEKVSPEFLTMLPPEYRTVAVKPEFLPEAWYGYEGAGLLILPAGTLKFLREKQFRALQEWVERGGFLVTAADLQYGIFNEENARQLLDVRVTGFEKRSALPGLQSFCGRGLSSREPFWVLKTEMPGAVSLATEKGLPLILQKSSGLGRILFLAFDHQSGSFSAWPGKELFWQKILSLKPNPDLQPLELDREMVKNTMLAAVPLGFPALWSVLAVWGAYFALFKIVLWKMKTRKIRPQTAFLICLTWSILLAGVCWARFYHKNNSEQINVSRFWHLKKKDNQALTFCRSLTGLYTVKDRPYRFGYDLADHPAVPLLPTKLQEKTLNSLSLDRTVQGQRLTLHPGKWSYRFLVMDWIVTLPLTGKAFLEGRDLIVEFNNPTSYTIKNNYFYFRERLFSLEDLKPGQSLIKKFSAKEISEQEMFSGILAEKAAQESAGRASGRYAEYAEKIMVFEALTRIEKATAGRGNEMHFCGWIERDFMPLTYEEPAIQGEGITFFEWTLPVLGAEE